jgi:hypothetical protein
MLTNDEVESAINVLKIFLDPKMKTMAQKDEKIRELFELGQEVFYPSETRIKELQKRQKHDRKEHDRMILDKTLIRISRPILKITSLHGGSEKERERPPIFGSADDMESFLTKEQGHLNYQRTCHICKNSFKKVHHFYDQLCSNCSEFNFAKRSFSFDLTDKVALVTGARVKIGYQIALKLLRMNCTVLITTRFPHDASIRFSKENDFEEFGNRLYIYGIDFRDISMVHQFARHIKHVHPRLDILINNAAQVTICLIIRLLENHPISMLI